MLDFTNRRIDFPEYVLGITKDIWEGREIGARMRDHYARDVVVRMPSGITTGEPAATAAVMSALVEFPGYTPLGEDVIWAGNPSSGFFSSHRTVSTATHSGDGAFGRASGRSISFVSITDSFITDSQIVDEWRVADNSSIVRQMGIDVQDWARGQLHAGARAFTPDADIQGQYTGRGDDSPWGTAYCEILQSIMSAQYSIIPEQYDRACQVRYPDGCMTYGWTAIDCFWMALRASFPDAKFQIHHSVGNEDALLAPRAAVRWSLTGAHSGWGRFGAPTGAPVHIMGMCHAEFGPRGLRREWALFDETAIWMQIFAHTG